MNLNKIPYLINDFISYGSGNTADLTIKNNVAVLRLNGYACSNGVMDISIPSEYRPRATVSCGGMGITSSLYKAIYLQMAFNGNNAVGMIDTNGAWVNFTGNVYGEITWTI